MADNQKNTRGGSSEQHAEAGRQSHKNQGGKEGGNGGGFAGMDPEEQCEIASKGGKAAHGFDSEEAREAGRKGGENSHGGGGNR